MTSGEPPTDEALFRAYVAGDEAAFRVLFGRYAPRLERLMRRGMGSTRDAHDLVQQAFLQVHRARHDFRADGTLRPWVMAIALNVKRQHLRRWRSRPEAPAELDDRTGPSVPGHDPVAAERSRQLRAALGRLSDVQREAIELHWLEGFSFPEVAELVGASVSAVKVRAHRGYARLRELLAEAEGNRPGPSRTDTKWKDDP